MAASIAVHALHDGLDVVVRTTDRGHPGQPGPSSHDAHVLDLLTPVQQACGTDLLSVAALFTGGLDQTSVTLVTGPGRAVERARRRRLHRRRRASGAGPP